MASDQNNILELNEDAQNSILKEDFRSLLGSEAESSDDSLIKKLSKKKKVAKRADTSLSLTLEIIVKYEYNFSVLEDKEQKKALDYNKEV